LDYTTPEARGLYLDEACGGDKALRASVEALLKNLQHDSFLESPAAGPGGTVISDFTGEKTGDVIGRYKLMEKIGEGGFGTVYVAEQREPVRRHVALKIVKQGMDTRQV